jgi:hypothetical protein
MTVILAACQLPLLAQYNDMQTVGKCININLHGAKNSNN